MFTQTKTKIEQLKEVPGQVKQVVTLAVTALAVAVIALLIALTRHGS